MPEFYRGTKYKKSYERAHYLMRDKNTAYFFTLSKACFPECLRFFEVTMRDETKPVRCGCGGKAEWVPDYYGGHVTCKKCGTQSAWRMSKEKAVKLWNEAMGAFGRGEYWEDDDE